jgi:hypothetical protein
LIVDVAGLRVPVDADAVIVAVPAATATTCGVLVGCVWPAAK